MINELHSILSKHQNANPDILRNVPLDDHEDDAAEHEDDVHEVEGIGSTSPSTLSTEVRLS